MVEVIIFNGTKFRRYPESKNRTDRLYFTPGKADKINGIGRLHEEVWKHENGPIPEKHHIHHKDENPLNNELSNLECIPYKEHMSYHSRKSSWTKSERGKVHLSTIREMTKEWHASQAGREWHSEHGKKVWEGLLPIKKICVECGKTFQTKVKRDNVMFCSTACEQRKRQKDGKLDIERICPICGTIFKSNKYRGKETCSKKCFYALRKQKVTEPQLSI